MILILSKSEDQSTSKVIKWLLFFKKQFIRINRNDFIKSLKITLGEQKSIEIKIGQNEFININNINGFWYRRGGFQIQYSELNEILEERFFKERFEKFRVDELKIITDYCHKELEGLKSIGSFFNKGVNKLMVLQTAQKLKIKIPNTILATEKKEVIKFLKKEKRIICKAIYEIPFFISPDQKLFKGLTKEIDSEKIESLPDHFFPTLFQKLIEKKIELRIFYLHGEVYSMAIFSQKDPQTSIDFRNYNKEYPNRTVPFQLPKNVENKLHLLMKQINLNSGSIDMIVTKQNEFVFLEVNPVGQFGMTSTPCNFYLEKKIAEFF